MINIKEHFKHKNITHKYQGDEIVLQVCPFCGDNKYHYYMNSQTGYFHCKKCDKAGTFYEYLQKTDSVIPFKKLSPAEEEVERDCDSDIDHFHEDLLANGEAYKYAIEQGFTPTAIQNFRIGLKREGPVSYLVYPFIKNGKAVNAKLRTMPPAEKGFRRLVAGGESWMFNEDVLNEDLESIILTEGESDAIALWGAGFPNVVGVTLGAQGFKTAWVDKLDKFKKIYLMYDSDEAGQQGSKKVAHKLGIQRCYTIKLPDNCKDIRQFITSEEGITSRDMPVMATIQMMLDDATLCDVDSVKSIVTLLEEELVRIKADKRGVDSNVIPFPWQNINKLVKGMTAGDLVVVSGIPGVGKTSFSLDLLYHVSMVEKVPSLLFELEMRPERIMPRIMGRHYRQPSQEVHDIIHIGECIESFKDMPLYIAYPYKKETFETVSDTISLSVKRYSIGFVVFDNLHFLIRGDDNIVQKVSMVCREFKLLAEALMIPIVLIARPRKLQGRSQMGTEDLMWSADIEADADIVIILHRDKEQVKSSQFGFEMEHIFKDRTMVKIAKARYSSGGVAWLTAHDAECWFDDLTQSLQGGMYGKTKDDGNTSEAV